MGVKPLYIGNMDRRIQIMSRTKTKTTTGAETFENTLIATLWAAQKTTSTNEEVDDKIVLNNTYEYLIRHYQDVADQTIQNLYIIDNNITYDIYGVETIGRRQFIKLKSIQRE